MRILIARDSAKCLCNNGVDSFIDGVIHVMCVQAMQTEGKYINIKAVMDLWTLQMGYPVVTISKNDSTERTVTVTQEHFIYDADIRTREPNLLNKRYTPATPLVDVRCGHV